MTFPMTLQGKTEAEARQSFAEWAAHEPHVDARLLSVTPVTGKPWNWEGEVEVTPREQAVMSLGL